MRAEYAFSERRACRLMTMAVSSYRYETRRSDEPLHAAGGVGAEEAALRVSTAACAAAAKRRPVNHKRLHRMYREAGLTIRRKKRKHWVRVGQPLRAWTAANQEWAWILCMMRWSADGRSGC